MANQNNNNTANFWASIFVGLLAIGCGFYAAFILKVKDDAMWYTWAVLISLSAALLTFLFAGFIKISGSLYGIHTKAAGGVAVFMIVFVSILKYGKSPKQDTSLKIQVRQENGSSALANEKKALKISIGKDTKVHDLDGNAEVLLNAFADTDSLQIELLNNDYQLAKSQSATAFFKIPQNEVLTLTVEPAQSRCCLVGRVMFADKKQQNLANITVQAAGVSTQTDAQGNYRLEIPKPKRLENLSI